MKNLKQYLQKTKARKKENISINLTGHKLNDHSQELPNQGEKKRKKT